MQPKQNILIGIYFAPIKASSFEKNLCKKEATNYLA